MLALRLINRLSTPDVYSRSTSWLPWTRVTPCPSLCRSRNLVNGRSGKRSVQRNCQNRSRSLKMICRAQASTATQVMNGQKECLSLFLFSAYLLWDRGWVSLYSIIVKLKILGLMSGLDLGWGCLYLMATLCPTVRSMSVLGGSI